MATADRFRGRVRAIRDAALSVAVPTTERGRERRRIAALCAPFFALAAVAGFYPLWKMVRISVSTQRFVIEGFSLGAYRELATDPYLRRSAIDTLWFSLSTTLLSLAVAVPVAHALERYDLPGKRLLVTLISFPISLPGIVAAFMIIVLFGNTGVATNAWAALTTAPVVGGLFPDRTAIDVAFATAVAGLFVAYLYSMVPRSVLLLRGAYAEVNRDAEEAARSLGASPARTFYRVTLPQIKPGLVGAFVLTFRTAMAIFGTVVILQALNVWTYEIDRALSTGGYQIQLASAMATLWFGFVLLFTVGALRYTSAEVGL